MKKIFLPAILGCLLVLWKWQIKDTKYYRNIFGVYWQGSCGDLFSINMECNFGFFPKYVRIYGADPFSFRILKGHWASDGKHLYCGKKVSAELSQYLDLGDKFVGLNDQTYEDCRTVILVNKPDYRFDHKSFAVISNTNIQDRLALYTRSLDVVEDSASLETPFNKAWIPSSFDLLSQTKGNSGKPKSIEEVKGSMFHIGCNFYKNNSEVFFQNTQFADSNGFSPHTLLEGADAQNFKVLLGNLPVSKCKWGQYGTDGKSVWWQNFKMKAEPKSFRIAQGVPNLFLACDKTGFYRQGRKIFEKDRESIEEFSEQLKNCRKSITK